MTLWAHTLVKNEDKYLWYSVMSVINYVDKILLWDTGSTDRTVEIIKEIGRRYPKKVIFKEFGTVDPALFTIARQKMLKETKSDWVIIVDGDEVWWDEKIREVRQVIDKNGSVLDSIVSKYCNVIGDIYHYQDESTGKYNIDGKVGYLTIRAFNRNIKGIEFAKPHGQQGIYDGKSVLLQNRDPKKRYWQDGYSYLHFTNMQRSTKRSEDLKVPKRGFKLKYEIGHGFDRDYYYPEVFFNDRPSEISNVWSKADTGYQTRALIYTPMRFIKRKLIQSTKSGY